MSEPTSSCPALPCASCDAWLGLVGKRVLTVTDHEDALVVTMESVAVPVLHDCGPCGLLRLAQRGSSTKMG